MYIGIIIWPRCAVTTRFLAAGCPGLSHKLEAAAALTTASLLATPYVLDYDLVVLAIAIAYLARHGLSRGFRAFEISLLAVVWVAPLLSREIARLTGVPVGLLVLLALHSFIFRRALQENKESSAAVCSIAKA